VVKALGAVARVHGISQIARDTGKGRESLYKALSPEGIPEFAIFLQSKSQRSQNRYCQNHRHKNAV